jgi:hypothetical protein
MGWGWVTVGFVVFGCCMGKMQMLKRIMFPCEKSGVEEVDYEIIDWVMSRGLKVGKYLGTYSRKVELDCKSEITFHLEPELSQYSINNKSILFSRAKHTKNLQRENAFPASQPFPPRAR